MINRIIEIGLSDTDLQKIYEHLENTPEDKKFRHPNYGHIAYFSWLPDQVVDKINKVMADQFPEDKLELRELSFARYDNSVGVKPQLYPHFDNPFQEQRFTLDIQVKSTIDWPIVVEGNEYVLKDNQGLIFSGTHQIHWRVDKTFKDSDFVEMIFCHFSKVGAEKISDDHRKAMLEREADLLKVWHSKQ
jgi:hypothetical protein